MFLFEIRRQLLQKDSLRFSKLKIIPSLEFPLRNFIMAIQGEMPIRSKICFSELYFGASKHF